MKPPIIVNMSLERIIAETHGGIIPFIVRVIAARLTRSLSAKKSITERSCDGYFFDMKFSRKLTKAVNMNMNSAMFLLLNARAIATTNASMHLSHVMVKNIFSLFILILILLPAHVHERRRYIQGNKASLHAAEISLKCAFNFACILKKYKAAFIA